MRLCVVTTHPIQYQAPLFRLLAARHDLTVVFMLRQTPAGQAAAGFGLEFEWDVPLTEGYRHVFAQNIATHPSCDRRNGIRLRGQESLLRELRPEALLVMGWFPHGYLQVIRSAGRVKIPLVCRGESNLVSGRSLLKRCVKAVYFRHLFRRFRTFAVIGRHNREFYLHYGVPEDRLFAAPYSVDTEFFEREYARHRPAQRSPGPWRIGFVGKLIPKKRPLDLVAAVAACRAHDRMQLVVVGDGPLRGELEGLARKLQVRLELRGFLNQSRITAQGYADLDALVLPSGEYETWGLVVNEAMTGGIPAIVSDLVGCAPDLIEPGRTGYVFPSGDIAALTGCLERLVQQLDAGHDFRHAVRERMRAYSLSKTTAGIEAAMRAAAGQMGPRS